jgi:hypothetical protein
VIFIEKCGAAMLNQEGGHHYLFVTPDQVSRLHSLAEASNSLFRRAQVISVLDLLYAALWRQLSAINSIAATMKFTVLEKPQRYDQSPDAGLNVLRYTFMSMGEGLILQPLVATAQTIRRHLTEADVVSDYEGWLIDSHEGGGTTSIWELKLEGLVGSSLEPSSLCRYLAYCSEKRGLSLTDNSSSGAGERALRLFCISGINRDGFRRSDDLAESPDLALEDIERKAVSVDLWLPQDELSYFRLVYGDSCFIDDAFFGN